MFPNRGHSGIGRGGNPVVLVLFQFLTVKAFVAPQPKSGFTSVGSCESRELGRVLAFRFTWNRTWNQVQLKKYKSLLGLRWVFRVFDREGVPRTQQEEIA